MTNNDSSKYIPKKINEYDVAVIIAVLFLFFLRRKLMEPESFFTRSEDIYYANILFYLIVLIIVVTAYSKIYLVNEARNREKALDYDKAAEIWDSLGHFEEAGRLRKLKSDMEATKIDQTVVQGDQITKTEIKDSVVSKSNIGATGKDKFARLEKLTKMKDKGLIDADEFKQMKKEILGK